MGRTATFKAREGYRGPTGMVTKPAAGEETGEKVVAVVEESAAEEEATVEVTADEVEADNEPVGDVEDDEEIVVPEDEPEWDKPYPQGNPVSDWKVAEIDAWATDQDPVVEFASGATKNQKLSAVAELQDGKN